MTLIFAPPITPVEPSVYANFWQAINTNDESAFLQASNAGLLEGCLPEWQRMRGQYNTQHATHEFTLDVHTAKVLTKTRQSPYFKGLPPQWQELITLAALLHDIDKEGGLAQDRFHLKPDMAHPAKAVATVRKRLPTWGFSQQAVEWASLLVGHHQAFGRWIMRAEFMKVEPTPAEIDQLADTLRSAVLLQALQALTEGDIRGVKGDDALFTPFAQERLASYGAMVHKAVLPIESAYQHRLESLLSQISQPLVEPNAWLFSSDMKTETLQFSVLNLPRETLIATMPLSFLKDADASQCGVCNLKNQASNRVFPVTLQPLRCIIAPCLRVGILSNQLVIVGGEGQLSLRLSVQNPVMLETINQ